MIQQQTILRVADNSGAKYVKCIKVLGGFKRKFAFTGDIIVVSVFKLRNKFRLTSKVKKGEVYKAIVLKTKHNYYTKTGFKDFASDNSVCLINKQGKPIATRIFGLIPRSLKKHKWIKISSLSTGFF
nr:ribosomal protein L14 [Guinardia delicatula]